MKDLRERLIDFEIDNIEKLLNYFITCHEYSFTAPFFRESKVKPKDLFLGYAQSLNHVTDLERLWYGLELKYILFLIEEFPLMFLKNSINKTLKDINTIDIEVLSLQTESFSNVILDEGIKGLILRPILLIEDDAESMFYPMSYTIDKLYDFIEKYRTHIATNKIKKYKILPAKITEEYIDADTVIVEIWSLLIQGYFIEKLYPMVLSEIENNTDNENEEFISVDVELNQDEIIELSATMIEAVFKNTKMSDKILLEMFDELTPINIMTLSNMLSNNFNI